MHIVENLVWNANIFDTIYFWMTLIWRKPERLRAASGDIRS